MRHDKSGRRWYLKCPTEWHGKPDNTPSLVVYADGSFYCFGCKNRHIGGKMGKVSIAELLAKHLHIEQCEILDTIMGVDLLDLYSNDRYDDVDLLNRASAALAAIRSRYGWKMMEGKSRKFDSLYLSENYNGAATFLDSVEKEMR